MSNMTNLLDTVLKWRGENLCLMAGGVSWVEREAQKLKVLKKRLTPADLKMLLDELHAAFGTQDCFDYKDCRFRVQSTEDRIDVIVEGAAGKGKDASSSGPSRGSLGSPGVGSDGLSSERADRVELDRLFRLMVDTGASDLHLSTGSRPALRIHGDIRPLTGFPIVAEEELQAELDRIMPEVIKKEFADTHDADFAYAIDGLARFRSNVFQDNHGTGAVFRMIPSNILTIEELGLPGALVELCGAPKGLILVTGPTGSGKSTTLAALIDHINRTQDKHIITVEDPIEFVYENRISIVNQREVRTHTQSFKKALRAALREDPDIILVGEMRDLETISIAVEMAVTGHLVFATLHTSTAIGTVDRIIDQFPGDQRAQIKTMLADSLIGVCSQMLLRKTSGGRIGAYEVLIGTPGIANLIREGKNFQIATLMQTSRSLGMQTMNQALLEMVEKRQVEPAEALSKAIDKQNLKVGLKARGLLNPEESATGQARGPLGAVAV